MSNNIFETDLSQSQKIKIKAKNQGQISHSISFTKKGQKQSSSFTIPIISEQQDGEKKRKTKLSFSFQGKPESQSSTSQIYYNYSKNCQFEMNYSNYWNNLKFTIHNSQEIQGIDTQYTTRFCRKNAHFYSSFTKKLNNTFYELYGDLEYEFAHKKFHVPSLHFNLKYNVNPYLFLLRTQLVRGRNCEIVFQRELNKSCLIGTQIYIDKQKLNAYFGLQKTFMKNLKMNGIYNAQKKIVQIGINQKINKIIEYRFSVQYPKYKDAYFGFGLKINL